MAKKNAGLAAYEEIRAALEGGEVRPLYLFYGDEPFFAAQLTTYLLEHLIPEDMRSFNQFLLYGRDASAGQIADQCRRSPMMGDHLLLVVREAQDMRKYDALADYFERPSPSTVLVLHFTNNPGITGKSSPLARMEVAARQHGAVLRCTRFREYEVGSWLNTYAAGQGIKLTPEANSFIVEQMGTDLSAIANELHKLRINLPAGKTNLGLDDVSEAIGVSRDFSVFELNRAIGQGDSVKAFRIATNMAANPKANDITFITAQVHSYFVKIFLYGILSRNTPPQDLAAAIRVNPYFLREYQVASAKYPPDRCAQIFSMLRDLDMRNKGVGGEALPLGEALKEMLTRIMR